MRPFLLELAQKLLNEHPRPEDVTVVFPNRRAALYFRKYVSQVISRPVFAPNVITIEDFVAGFSPLRVPDKLELVYRLFRTYTKTVGIEEPFDQFYFWGEMLLRDFEEVDRYLIDAALLFRDLSNQKELDARFDFLTEEHQKFLTDFWGGFAEHHGKYRSRFLDVWHRLPAVYEAYGSQLRAEGLAYEGMLQRQVAENIESHAGPVGLIWFAGFNALTRAEEKILSHFVERHGATVHWDVDAYYVNNKSQEAGEFFREYQQHPVLGRTFPSDVPANFSARKTLTVVGAAQPVGQAKVMAQLLAEQLKNGAVPEETLVVLPDEALMLPVLHGISGQVEKMNVTMGFSLSSTPMCNLVELLVELQSNRKEDNFNHRQVMALLSHPYVLAANSKSSRDKQRQIVDENLIRVSGAMLRSDHAVYQVIFRVANEQNILAYAREVIQVIAGLDNVDEFDREYAFYFIRLFNRMEDLLGSAYSTLRAFLRLFRQLVRTQKIPFTGEPLKGLQVMGVLETRNLDFKNIFVLSLNEGAFPSGQGKGSFLPYNVRRAYSLPTPEHQDAIYAYLFYRVLQRAENIFLIYNSETDVLGQGEMSRYLQQLIYESSLNPTRLVLHNTIRPQPVRPIVIRKDAGIMETLARLNEGNTYFKGISPSALNTYIECKLKFYFKHVARIKEPDEVEEDIDARVMGNFLHDVMELFYKGIRDRKGNKQVEAGDFADAERTVDRLIDEVFIKEYNLEKGKVTYEGQQLVVKEVVKKIALRILGVDRVRAPFTIEGIEQGGLLYNIKISRPPGYAVIGGKIDRVDRKGDEVRVVDYKTGKDKMDFESIASLFEQNKKRNKAAFQTLLYALLYKTSHAASLNGARLVPGLINRENLFKNEFDFGLVMAKEMIRDAQPLLPEFEDRLRALLEELFNPGEKFDQTAVTESCRICPYQQICYR